MEKSKSSNNKMVKQEVENKIQNYRISVKKFQKKIKNVTRF